MVYCGLHWKGSWVAATKVKADQLKATGANVVITPCHTCYSGIKEIVAYHTLDMDVKFLLEILMECIEIPKTVHRVSCRKSSM